jgi:hypothetical protein
VSWNTRFAEPIVLPNGIKLASLRDSTPSPRIWSKLSPPQSAVCRHIARVFNPDGKEALGTAELKRGRMTQSKKPPTGFRARGPHMGAEGKVLPATKPN